MVKNDFKKNIFMNLILIIFIALSIALVVLSVFIASHTVLSISQFYSKAQPPHFLYMSKKNINRTEIEKFMKKSKGVKSYQINEMINVYGSDFMVFSNKTVYDLSDFKLDISFVKQNEKTDLLLNSQHEKIILNRGEIGIPVLLKEKYSINIGDSIMFSTGNIKKTFVVKEFILDSLMNSTLASSTRFLLSDYDFKNLNLSIENIEKEFLIEVYLYEKKDIADFKNLYENSHLFKSGQVITYNVIFFLSAFTDMVSVFLIFLMSLFFIFISLICIKFIILSIIEEERNEIGIMKAIGIRFSDISKLYLLSYKILAFIGFVLGIIIAFLLFKGFISHINSTFGDIKQSCLSVFLGLSVGIIVLFFLILFYKRVLLKYKKSSVLHLLGSHKNSDNFNVKSIFFKFKKLPINFVFPFYDIYYNSKKFFVLFLVIFIALFVVVIPINIVTTIKSKTFVTYMGNSSKDIFIEIKDSKNLKHLSYLVKNILEKDSDVFKYEENKRVALKLKNDENRIINLNVDCGNFAGENLNYLSGKAPLGENQIALSILNARVLSKTTGDYITVNEKNMLISGIYQDMTSGGYSAKTKCNFQNSFINRYTYSVELNKGVKANKKIKQFSGIIKSGINIYEIDEFIKQILGLVIEQLKKIAFMILFFNCFLVGLITVLFLKLEIIKESSEIAILKCMGFSSFEIKFQYMVKIFVVSIVSIFLGIFSSNLLGNNLVNSVLKLTHLGVEKIQFVKNPIYLYVFIPLLFELFIIIVAFISTKKISKYKIVQFIHE